jgi:hypothetical protein
MAERWRISSQGSLTNKASAGTAGIHLAAGTSSANTAPLKFTSGSLLTTTEAGAVEYDGSHLYFTANNGGARYQLDQQAGGGGANYWSQSGTDISYNNGNVGIGIANPDNAEAWGKLVEVRGYNHSKFLVSTANESILTCLWSHDGAGFGGAPAGGMTGTSSNHPFSILTNKISRITVTTAGDVGIGTASPGPYKLAVEGTIGARKIKVTQATPWADYVFEEGYKLPTLTELEEYVLQNKHLPDVPSAKEIQKNGLDLGDNQAVLLKKIEELTLYIIDINKKLKNFQKKTLN